MAYQRKYTREYRLQMVKLYYEQKELCATDFALLNNIPDSTFFGWLKEYKQYKNNWLNITEDIKNSDIPLTSKYEIICPNDNLETSYIEKTSPLTEGFIEIEYKGVIIRAESKYLKSILGFIHKW